MAIQAELKSYSDIRKFASPGAFSQAMSYISWHNRLTLTHMLLPWEALVVTLAYEQKSLDTLQYQGIKSFLDSTREVQPKSLEECQERAGRLLASLYSA